MNRKFRMICMGLAVHLLLSGTLWAGLHVCSTGYNHTHADQIQPASLRVSGNTAELTLLTNTVQLHWPVPQEALCIGSFLLAGNGVRGWVWLAAHFIK